MLKSPLLRGSNARIGRSNALPVGRFRRPNSSATQNSAESFGHHRTVVHRSTKLRSFHVLNRKIDLYGTVPGYCSLPRLMQTFMHASTRWSAETTDAAAPPPASRPSEGPSLWVLIEEPAVLAISQPSGFGNSARGAAAAPRSLHLPGEGRPRELVAVPAVRSDRADWPAHDRLRGLARPSAPTGVAQ